jgi:uncharacterized membrane protein
MKDGSKGRSVPSELRPSNRRLEAFSDGIFAIVVTIMILEIRIPDELAIGGDPLALMRFTAVIATYALSFVVIAIFWSNHHYLIFTLPKADRATIWLNNNVLFWITLIPVVARFFGEHPTSPRAAAAYAFVIMTCTMSFSLLRKHGATISRNQFHRALHRRVFRRIWLAVAFYALAMPLGFVDIRLAWACLAVLPVIFFLPITRDE